MISEIATKPVNILMVEDNPADADLLRQALKTSAIVNNKLSVASDGVEAMEFLRREASGPERPDLVILDLNLPKKDGRAVLSEIKSDPDLRRIPTVILTSSRADVDIFHCYDRHANCYIVKPMELDQFFAAVRRIEDFWFATAELPRE